MRRPDLFALTTALCVLASATGTRAHSGPPFPIVTDRASGPYTISIWTDPDTTDDGSAGGQFWIMIGAADGVPPRTRATIAVAPAGAPDAVRSATAVPVRDDDTTQFAGVVLDHEGRFVVRVSVDGPLGASTVESAVDATYDLRPPRSLIALYLVPFVLVALLWGKLLLRRRRVQRP